MEPALFRQSSFRAKITDASRDLGCDPWSIHQPRPPYQTGALAPAGGGGQIRMVFFCTMPQFVTLGANGKAIKFWLFVIRVYYDKLCHMLKPLVPKFRNDLCSRLKDVAEKQVPAKLRPIVGINVGPIMIQNNVWQLNVGGKTQTLNRAHCVISDLSGPGHSWKGSV